LSVLIAGGGADDEEDDEEEVEDLRLCGAGIFSSLSIDEEDEEDSDEEDSDEEDSEDEDNDEDEDSDDEDEVWLFSNVGIFFSSSVEAAVDDVGKREKASAFFCLRISSSCSTERSLMEDGETERDVRSTTVGELRRVSFDSSSDSIVMAVSADIGIVDGGAGEDGGDGGGDFLITGGGLRSNEITCPDCVLYLSKVTPHVGHVVYFAEAK